MIPRGRPETAVELGLMRGAPPPDERLVTLANWHEPPFNRWSYLHAREIVPTARIGRGDGPVTHLDRDERDLTRLSFRFRGESWTVGEMLDATYTDGFIVLHRGRIVSELYGDAMTPVTTHLLQSVSKSLAATLTGVLVGQDRLDPEAMVVDYVEDLRGTSFEGCSVQHLLDMRAGTRFSEDYADPESDIRISEQVVGWRPRERPGLPGGLYAYLPSLESSGPHGGPFAYRSILSDLLGWVIERAAGASFAELFETELWSRIGAERDAEVTVDAHGAALVDGGICTTLRDLARIGLLHLDDGKIGGNRVVPSSWIGRLLTPDPALAETFEPRSIPRQVRGRDMMYHDQWWVLDPRRGVYTGLGIHGQQLTIHRPSGTVVAKVSTQPAALDRDLFGLQLVGSIAIAKALAAGRV